MSGYRCLCGRCNENAVRWEVFVTVWAVIGRYEQLRKEGVIPPRPNSLR